MNAPIEGDFNGPTRETLPRPQSLLRVEAVSKSFGSTKALDNVNFEAFPGEVHAIVGENGAGKSTLINVAAGVVKADTGFVVIAGAATRRAAPRSHRRMGITVAFQHPALPADLTVYECLCVADPTLAGRDGHKVAQAMLDRITSEERRLPINAEVKSLNLMQKHVVEITKAISANPRVIVFDEPTEPLEEEQVRVLFDLIKDLKREGKAIVYISHRLHEIWQIADRVTVLRDGRTIATKSLADITMSEIISMIVGRPLEQVFPKKRTLRKNDVPALQVRALKGPGFANVNLDVCAGEIVGVTGVDGQGQREFLRSLAGVAQRSEGSVTFAGALLPANDRRAALNSGLGFITDDRHKEGLFLSMSVEENSTFGILPALARAGIIDAAKKKAAALTTIAELNIKTVSEEETVSKLSGGNQQKVLLGSVMSTRPRLLLIDEPTKGVDIGSRSDIYHHLAALTEADVGIVMLASDGVELEGLCDRVLVFNSGHPVCELVGRDVTDRKITEANLQSGSIRSDRGGADVVERSTARRILFPAIALAIVVSILFVGTSSVNVRFASATNLENLMVFLSVLAFISFGQLSVVMMGQIDLSLGALAGFSVVLSSFLIPEGGSVFQAAFGAVLVLAIAALFGYLQGAVIVGLRLPSIIVTLSSLFLLQGLSFLFRPQVEGTIDPILSNVFRSSVGGVPLCFIGILLSYFAFEWLFWRTNFGRCVRAIGSDADSAFRLGAEIGVVGPLVFALAGLLAGLGGLILAGEVGIGSATAGANYTLLCITAVVLGGASIAGGGGSFLLTLLGAAVVQLTFFATAFLSMSSAWQYWLVGGTTLVAAALIQRSRRST
jgi:ribose transport system ATP-binding protein